MKFKFTIQQYQTDAVESTVNIFSGQKFHSSIAFRQDLGDLNLPSYGQRNPELNLDSEELLENIRSIQKKNEIKQSIKLIPSQGLGACVLDIEMETGTGKTYVYIKTMFELKRQYGWKKYIVVVPTVAIREGVAKSFAMLEDHFMELYGEKARYFVYNSKQLNDIAAFADNNALSVMIINMQAFSASLKPDGTQKDAKVINSERDAFGSRRPIEVIADTSPILILDEPQKLEGAATLNGMKSFKPLFTLNYSATHKTKHNLVYALDAVDAFEQRLVKKIEVKGFEIKNNLGTSRFISLDRIEPTKSGPYAVIGHDVRTGSGIRQTHSRFMAGDSIYAKSNELKEYEHLTVTDIDAVQRFVEFQNGMKLFVGEVSGDINKDVMQRVQIGETIHSHLEKERELFAQGIKTLSLFFIDEVANYRAYDEVGNSVRAKFQTWFEDEYARLSREMLESLDLNNQSDKAYAVYLQGISAHETHAGYFSVDAKSRSINTKVKRDGSSDDVDAYDLILRDKERLLSFKEPTRFIFSHSALQEGWDNPNIFQICTLRATQSVIKKRQEVGRGLRICVNQEGFRQDFKAIGDRVHEVNTLTVIANESYSSFVSDLQKETRETLRERPDRITPRFFEGKTLRLSDGREHVVTQAEASAIDIYLKYNLYIDTKGQVTERYKQAKDSKSLAALQPDPVLDQVRPFEEAIHKCIQAVFDSTVDLGQWITDGRAVTVTNRLNKNFDKAEFKELWEQINHKYSYTVQYDSNELIDKAVASIDKNLSVQKLYFVKVTGEQLGADHFEKTSSSVGKESLKHFETDLKYDLIGEVAKQANLTRRTTAAILQKISPEKFALYAENPEEFIKKTALLIREQKATMIVQHLSYHLTSQRYGSEIFTLEKSKIPANSLSARKHVMDYVVTDSEIEQELAKSLEMAEEVSVYAKLPRSFQIPTPVGNYAPDWAIAFKKGSFRHIFFVAETKGSMDSMQLSGVENAKIGCAKKLFNEANLAGNVRYHQVASYKDLLNEIQRLDQEEASA